MNNMKDLEMLPSELLYRSFLLLIEGEIAQRYATFKLFYTDETPLEYEPPYFTAGDHKKDRFVFKTHDASEVPDKRDVGSACLGSHS
jgi:hypothetical protein